jgi:hypothetical protein
VRKAANIRLEESVKRQGWGESCSIRLWEREAYILNGARTSPKGEVRESKHAVEPGANSTGPCGRPHGRQKVLPLVIAQLDYKEFAMWRIHYCYLLGLSVDPCASVATNSIA